ncbi:HSF-type DNA-binding domain-containing protein [Arthroderma uncinatum]|uniref:HSF-type DNA-binding domain-containing protein n=1 Tax=Arthroderma uncinatum TaxID=74035 RepID=UPI00144A9A49|nr:HSF-type DNA-binding domain-containing protein [Arthroderma uncinatum]KAF3480751.1 HSF-type DNA-binding domain-containing protein [Arthroderma uncinatum]
MNRMLDPPLRNPFHGPSVGDLSAKSRTIPLISSTAPANESISPGDPMDMSPSTSTSMAPPLQNGPEVDSVNSNANHTNGTAMESMQSQSSNANHPIGAAAAGQQPKVVQTAFIHKLYSMLQDPSIQHLISWSSSNESFVMSPSSDFSKVLSQYFKHTNISSFVRQLNMYGFHKVSDVFHTGSPDSPMWEFRHGNGSFRKGDVAGLRDIKRRASRHALIHRDSFSAHKPNPSQPGTPAEPTVDGQDPRMATLEQSLYDMHNRLSRMEDQNALLSSHCHVLTEGLARCHQWTSSMSSFIVSLVPDTENSIHRDAANMQREITRQLDYIRTLENPQDAMVSGRQTYFSNMSLDPGPPPLSPRQVCQDDGRRPSGIRHPLPPHITISPHRHGSIGGTNPAPVYNKPQIPQQSSLHPLTSVSSPPGLNLARRHTSADIRQHGWPPSAGPSPNSQYGPTTSIQWPSSPSRNPNSSDQHVRDALARYELGGPRRQQEPPRHATPPLLLDPSQPDNGWSIGGPKFPRPVESLPATRRSSMASNVHSLLNPSSAAERIEENDGPLGEDRKRKRLQ